MMLDYWGLADEDALCPITNNDALWVGVNGLCHYDTGDAFYARLFDAIVYMHAGSALVSLSWRDD